MQNNCHCHLFLATVMFIGCLNSWGQDQHADGTSSNFSLTAEQLATLESNRDDHPVFLLKLLKYKGNGTEGRRSYKRYSDVSVARIRELGGDVIFYGKAKPFEIDFHGSRKLIGFRSNPWDIVVLERYRSRKDLRKVAASEDYRAATTQLRHSLEESILYALNGSPHSGTKRSRADTTIAPDPPSSHAVYMLNLLRFKPEGGKIAYYQKYGAAVMPLISKHGGQVIFDLEAEQLLMGEERYDRVILVMYPSVEDFTKMILSADYQKISHHRTDAIEIGHLDGFSNAAEELKSSSEQK